MAGALFGEVQVSLFVAGALFGEVQVSLFVGGSIWWSSSVTFRGRCSIWSSSSVTFRGRRSISWNLIFLLIYSDLYMLYLLNLLAPPRAALLVNMENIALCIPFWALLVAILLFRTSFWPRSGLVPDCCRIALKVLYIAVAPFAGTKTILSVIVSGAQ